MNWYPSWQERQTQVEEQVRHPATLHRLHTPVLDREQYAPGTKQQDEHLPVESAISLHLLVFDIQRLLFRQNLEVRVACESSRHCNIVVELQRTALALRVVHAQHLLVVGLRKYPLSHFEQYNLVPSVVHARHPVEPEDNAPLHRGQVVPTKPLKESQLVHAEAVQVRQLDPQATQLPEFSLYPQKQLVHVEPVDVQVLHPVAHAWQ